MTATMTPATIANRDAVCAAFWAEAVDHETNCGISFDRCTDWLLDLYQTTTNTQLRALVVDVLDDLRAIGPVEGEFEDVVLGALASVEAAFAVVAEQEATS